MIRFPVLIFLLLFSSSLLAQQESNNVASIQIIDKNGNNIKEAIIDIDGAKFKAIIDSSGYFRLPLTQDLYSLDIVKSDGTEEFVVINPDSLSASNLTYIISNYKLTPVLWCCTSHESEGAHCARKKDDLRDNHHEDEAFKRKVLGQ